MKTILPAYFPHHQTGTALLLATVLPALTGAAEPSGHTPQKAESDICQVPASNPPFSLRARLNADKAGDEQTETAADAQGRSAYSASAAGHDAGGGSIGKFLGEWPTLFLSPEQRFPDDDLHVSTTGLLVAPVLTVAMLQAGGAEGQPAGEAAPMPAPRAVHAERGGIGVGFIAGEPTGLSLKAWLTEESAVDAGFAWSFSDKTSFHIHADYLWHNYTLLPVSQGELPVYAGVGARIKFKDKNDDTRFGVRIPVGIAYHFPNVPVDIFAEVAPVLDLAPDTEFDINGGVGVRYYFR
jgi:hypothetical protein